MAGASEPVFSVTAARERFRLMEADESALATPLSIDCGRSETHASAEVFRKDGVLVRARVEAHPPGDTSLSYAFLFEQGTLAFVRYTVTGYAGDHKSVGEYRYYYDAWKRPTCFVKRASGTERETNARLSQAAEEKDDCKFAGFAHDLGTALAQGPSGRAALSKHACAI